MSTLPALDGVEHRFVDLDGGITIHVADAGPADGPAVMLVHGFPENWWEWHELIGPLAADGYRVLCPDLRGAGWSSAPRSRYTKKEMADDLAGVLDRLGIASVRLVAHDWGGPVAFIMMLRYPAKVTGFFGMNTAAPWFPRDLGMVRDIWRFWYQIPILLPVIGPRVIADPKARYFRVLTSWVGGGFTIADEAVRMYVERMRQPGHAVAGSRWYRTFQSSEALPWMRGEYADARVDVPVRWLHGTEDPVLTPQLLRGYEDHISDFEVEFVDGVGHWIVEQRPDLVLDRLRAFLRIET
ncbi:alpha/beta fold hydrolase [Mycobacterium ulcerans]|uniref:Epoxide hydrolase n=1 Tax=Mycobacterium ulcerans subsp. shinshuense TaxID=1124626 RepID=A0A1B4Y966_MYCUL|nr:alpha/beta hydrolase [Mycobacterium ulcerans]BAV43593.1 epoxide hydrolase [Mycobacterium ulcerans subsp. shinshuense]